LGKKFCLGDFGFGKFGALYRDLGADGSKLGFWGGMASGAIARKRGGQATILKPRELAAWLAVESWDGVRFKGQCGAIRLPLAYRSCGLAE
jgi:hypothetical protein